MALEFTEYGKQLILWNMFGGLNNNISSSTTLPTLAGADFGTVDSGGKSLVIQFYAGTRPDITDTTTLPRAWQGTAYTGTTKLWPQGSSIRTITSLLASGNATTTPMDVLNIDWTNNSIETSASSIASGANLLFAQGTVTWFAVYAGRNLGSISTGSGFQLAWTGSVGVTGSGSDIELNRTDIPSSSYPVEIKKLSFKFPQPSDVDVIFSKNIYTTTLANIIGAGCYIPESSAHATNIHNILNTNASANTKYVWTGSGVNRIQFYSGTRPSNPDASIPVDNTLIGYVDTFGMRYDNMTQTVSTSEVSLSKTGTYIGTASALGTPNWCRILTTNSSGTAAIDCSAGLAASNSAITIQDSVTSIGQQINVTSIKFILS